MWSPPTAEERLRQICELLRNSEEPAGAGAAAEEPRWHVPALPPFVASGRSSATDLLSWWFRPPSREASGWDQYFGKSKQVAASAVEVGEEFLAKGREASDALPPIPGPSAALLALIDWPEDNLAHEDADAAVEVLYDFLHAFARRDIPAAMAFVAEDYHVFENDREVDRRDFSSYLEALLESLYGFEFDAGLATVPEALRHPYGVVIYAEMQIDAHRAEDSVRRNIAEQRLVLLQKQTDSAWKIAAFSKPRS